MSSQGQGWRHSIDDSTVVGSSTGDPRIPVPTTLTSPRMALSPPASPTEYFERSRPEHIVDFLAKSTSKSMTIFRRFDRLALHNILRLSRRLERIESGVGDAVRWRGDRYEINLRDNRRIGIKGKQPDETDQPDDIEYAPLLHEYYEALEQYHCILNLEPPAHRTVMDIDSWCEKQRSAGFSGPAVTHNLLDEDNNREEFPDLIGLHSPGEKDLLSRFVHKWLKILFIDPKISGEGEYYIDEQRLQKFVTFVGMVFAVLFLVGAMWALWRLGDNMVGKLATVTGFVVAFAAWVGFCTSAGRKEVILATAAYAAVLVVFVSQPPSPT